MHTNHIHHHKCIKYFTISQLFCRCLNECCWNIEKLPGLVNTTCNQMPQFLSNKSTIETKSRYIVSFKREKIDFNE